MFEVSVSLSAEQKYVFNLYNQWKEERINASRPISMMPDV